MPVIFGNDTYLELSSSDHFRFKNNEKFVAKACGSKCKCSVACVTWGNPHVNVTHRIDLKGISKKSAKSLYKNLWHEIKFKSGSYPKLCLVVRLCEYIESKPAIHWDCFFFH